MIMRLWNWFSGLLRSHWVSTVLLIGLITSATVSLDEANWVVQDEPLITALILGVVFGWALAISGFKGWFVTLYAIFISLVIPVETVAKVTPSLDLLLSTSIFQVFNQMNLRAWEFYLRVTGWLDTLQGGENIRDSGIFVLLMGWVLALCGIWLMWSMYRQRKVLNGLLPLGILMAVNVQLSHQSITNLAVFLFFALLLVAFVSFTWQHQEWAKRRVDHPEQLGLEWGMSAMALVVIIVLLARAAPLFGTAEGWKILSDWYEKTRASTSDTATRLFSGVNPSPLEPTRKPDVYVNTPSLGEIGDPIPQGSDVIMWVKISDPAPLPPEVSGQVPNVVTRIHYWRNKIFNTYTGRGWTQAKMAEQAVQKNGELPDQAPLGRYFLTQDYEIVARNKGSLFSVNDPIQTSAGILARSLEHEPSYVLEGQQASYQVVSAATDVTANALMIASTDYPLEIRRDYTQLPDTLPQRVRTLALRITDGADNPYHKAMRIQEYLRQNFPYELNVGTAPEKRDVVDYFLFDSGKGFCTHYASSMAVMLRSLGIPARVVTGYAMGSWDDEKQAYWVPVSAAHAWVEVYFPGYGWVEFEPTPYRTPFEYPEEGPSMGGLPPTDLNRGKSSELTPAFLGMVVAIGLAALALPFFLLRMFFGPRQSAVRQANSLYRNMRRALGWAGLPALASVTPDEYLMLYQSRLEPYQQLNKALVQATAVYRETTYSQRPPDERQVRIASQLWQASLRDWFVLFAWTAWQRIRKKTKE